MFGISPHEMLLVAIVGLLLFGKKLPEVARGLGKSLVEFKRGISGIQDEIHSAVHNAPSRSTPSPRPMPIDDRDEVTAPKFEPPKFEPAS